MRVMTKLFTWLATLCLLGCATTNVGSSYGLTDKSSEGLVVASLSYEGLKKGEVPTWYYRPVGTEEVKSLVPGTLPLPLDWEWPRGTLVYFALPAGRYEFFRCGLTRSSRAAASWHIGRGGIATNADPIYVGLDSVPYPSSAIYAKPFSVSFEISPGRATYIGDLHFIARVLDGELVVFDRSERDLTLLRERLPLIRPEQIQNAAPRDRPG